VPLSAGGDEWCFCPCSRKAQTWRSIFNLDQYLDVESGDVCQEKVAYTAKGLLDHLTAVSRNEKDAILHQITLHYLEAYFDNFRGGYKHMAFYGLNDTNVRWYFSLPCLLNGNVAVLLFVSNLVVFFFSLCAVQASIGSPESRIHRGHESDRGEIQEGHSTRRGDGETLGKNGTSKRGKGPGNEAANGHVSQLEGKVAAGRLSGR
jgi:hypothetical protein